MKWYFSWWKSCISFYTINISSKVFLYIIKGLVILIYYLDTSTNFESFSFFDGQQGGAEHPHLIFVDGLLSKPSWYNTWDSVILEHMRFNTWASVLFIIHFVRKSMRKTRHSVNQRRTDIWTSKRGRYIPDQFTKQVSPFNNYFKLAKTKSRDTAEFHPNQNC
jgi:hypothetical protein